MKTNFQDSAQRQNKVQSLATLSNFFIGLLFLSIFTVSCSKDDDFLPVASEEAVPQISQTASDGIDIVGDGSFDDEGNRLKSSSSITSTVSITSVTDRKSVV